MIVVGLRRSDGGKGKNRDKTEDYSLARHDRYSKQNRESRTNVTIGHFGTGF